MEELNQLEAKVKMEELNEELFEAARKGNKEKVLSCLQTGADINCRDDYGKTPLHKAAGKGHDGVVKILLKGRAGVNAKDEDGSTPLKKAAVGGHDGVVKILLEGGGDVNAKDDWGYTPLHMAAREGHDGVVKILLEKGGDVNAKEISGWTPLHYAAIHGHDTSMKLLIDGGANVNIQNKEGRTPLHYAAFNGQYTTIKILIQGGANVNIQNKEGSSPLHMAVKVKNYMLDNKEKFPESKERVAKALVQAGVDIYSKDVEGKTALDYVKEDLRNSLEVLAAQVEQIKAAFPNIAENKEFRVLLMKGTYSSHNNRVYLAGACNVGKSTLASNLIGENILLEWNSTDGLVIYFGRNGIDLEKKEMVPLSKGPLDSIILASVLRGEPSLQSDKIHEDKVEKAGPSVPIELKNLAIQTDGATFKSVDTLSKTVLPTSQESPNIEMLSVKKDETVHVSTSKDFPCSLALTQKQTNIHQDIMEEIRKGEYKVKIAPSDLIDFGGQRAFDLTHQLFIQQKGVFVLLLDGRKKLDDILDEYKGGNMTTKEILLHWVNSVLIYCSSDDDNIYPLILFAATHRDELTEDEIQKNTKEITEELTEMFENHEHAKRIIYHNIFYINGTDINDPGVHTLKQFLVNAAFQQKSWGEKMPMAWVPLELQMVELRSSDYFVISFDQLQNLNQSNGDLALSENQLKDFLKCQHSLGRLLYFDFQHLSQYIIVKPEAMVDILRSFVTDQIFWPQEKELNTILNTASEKGLIQKCDLFKLWSQEKFNKFVPIFEMKEFISKVLVHLDVLVEPKRFQKQAEHQSESFIVPCIIRRNIPSSYLPYNLDERKTIILSYKLKKSAVPNAFAYKLIGAVLSIWPLQRKEEIWCLFDKAAVLEIDKENDLHLSFQNNQFVVALKNSKSKKHISPDIASVIQECLTLTITKVLEFYSASFGRSVSNTEISQFFDIEVGEKCGDEICFFPLSDVKKSKNWTCKNSTNHSTEFALHWVFEQRQEMCELECTGRYTDCLHDVPEDKHLIRLAKRVYDRFEEIIIHLGLQRAEWNDIKEEYSKPLTRRFIALCRCRDQGRTFQDFSKALKDCDYSEHFLCQVFIDGGKKVLDEATIRHQETPDDKNLKELSEKIGDVAIPLGVELELSLQVIERICFKNKDMFKINYDILQEWKRKGEYTTILFLMKALYHADRRGYNFLRDTYKMLK